MSDKPTFWMVWSPRSRRLPRVKHSFKVNAEAEAKRLSLLLPGRHFYVLEMIGYAIEGPELSNKKERALLSDPARHHPLSQETPMEQDVKDETTQEPTAPAAEAPATEEPKPIDQADGQGAADEAPADATTQL